MGEPQPTSLLDDIIAELRRIGLDPDEVAGLVVAKDSAEQFLAHLRSLRPGSSWSAAFANAPAGWSPNMSERERALGPFDYPEPPRGPAVFASLIASDPEAVAANVLQRVQTLGVPIFGSGLVLDRGSPHLYVVLEHGASTDDVATIADFLRTQPGIANSYPVR